MVFHVKTILNISDSVLLRLREESAKRGTTMSRLVEAGLSHVLAEPAPSDPPPTELRPLPAWSGGKELVDLSNRDPLYKLMEEE